VNKQVGIWRDEMSNGKTRIVFEETRAVLRGATWPPTRPLLQARSVYGTMSQWPSRLHQTNQ
jgi:hypothetical protein